MPEQQRQPKFRKRGEITFKEEIVILTRTEYDKLIRTVDDVKRFAGIVSGKVEDLQTLVKEKV